MFVHVDLNDGSRVQMKMVGPLKRSTFERHQPDPEWESVTDVRHWSWCCRLQADRLRTSFLAEFPWQSVRKHHVPQERRFSTTSYDEHCLFVAAANLDRALKRGPKELRRVPDLRKTRRALWLLRNFYEHWDEIRRSYRAEGSQGDAVLKLFHEYPDAEPWALEYHTDSEHGHMENDIVVAGVVSLESLTRNLRKLEAKALWRLRDLRRQGRHVATAPPDPSPAVDL